MSDRCKPSGNKIRFASFEDAVHSAVSTSRIRGIPLRVYGPCEHCGAHHLTKKPASRLVPTVPAPFTPADMARISRREGTP